MRRRLTLTGALLLSSAGCLAMVALRVLLTHHLRYGFLLWNLFLAWIPYLLSLLIRKTTAGGAPTRGHRIGLAVLGLAWLLFYPNAPYILTDFIHIIRGPSRVPPDHPLLTENALLWYDIILNASFAFIGHFIGLCSMVLLHRTIRKLYRNAWAWVLVVLASVLGGYGIYLGRFERLNSWDAVRVPLLTLRVGLLNLFNLKAVLFSLAFALFIFLTYLIVYAFRESSQED